MHEQNKNGREGMRASDRENPTTRIEMLDANRKKEERKKW